MQWTFHGDLVKGSAPRRPLSALREVQRETGHYVLWYNWYPTLWNGQYAVAVSDTPQGPFSIHAPNVAVKEPKPGDLGLFVDDDGSGYLSTRR